MALTLSLVIYSLLQTLLQMVSLNDLTSINFASIKDNLRENVHYRKQQKQQQKLYLLLLNMAESYHLTCFSLWWSCNNSALRQHQTDVTLVSSTQMSLQLQLQKQWWAEEHFLHHVWNKGCWLAAHRQRCYDFGWPRLWIHHEFIPVE